MKKVLIPLICFSLFAILISQGKSEQIKKETRELFPIISNNKWGFINIKGEVVIDPQYDDVGDFHEGLAMVCKDNKFGFINNKGKIIIDLIFDEAGNYSDGLAVVRVGGKRDYVDRIERKLINFEGKKGGEESIKDMLGRPDRFKEHMQKGLAGKYGYIDIKGNIVIEPEFDWAHDFSEGLAGVSVLGKKGYIDKSGKYIVNPHLFRGEDFSEGLAVFSVDEEHGKCGFINKVGKIVLEPKYDHAFGFSEGLASVKVDKKWGYIDKNYKIVIEPQFSWAKDFHEGMAAIEIGGVHEGLAMFGLGDFTEGKVGYINKSGKIVINPKFKPYNFDKLVELNLNFKSSNKFSEGLAVVKIDDNGKEGYIDKNGKIIIKPIFDKAEDFWGGLAFVRIKDKYGYIDRSGNFIWRPIN
jgi:hypothetical protein